MSQPENLSFTMGHPMPTRDHAALLASCRLLLDQAAVAVQVQVRQPPSASFFEAWEVTRAALMARMAGTLRHLGFLAPSYSRIDGIALARTLVDHAITFAWLSGNPPERLPRFLRSSYSSLLAKDERATERGEDPLLTPDVRAGYEEYARTGRRMPNLSERATQADKSWVERVKATAPSSIQITDFRGLYDHVYDSYAEYDHPSTIGLGIFVHRDVDAQVVIVDGAAERDLTQDLEPYWLSVWAFADALVVSSFGSSHPRLEPLRRALQTIGTMRLLERQGRLVVADTSEGTTIGVASGDDGG